MACFILLIVSLGLKSTVIFFESSVFTNTCMHPLLLGCTVLIVRAGSSETKPPHDDLICVAKVEFPTWPQTPGSGVEIVTDFPGAIGPYSSCRSSLVGTAEQGCTLNFGQVLSLLFVTSKLAVRAWVPTYVSKRRFPRGLTFSPGKAGMAFLSRTSTSIHNVCPNFILSDIVASWNDCLSLPLLAPLGTVKSTVTSYSAPPFPDQTLALQSLAVADSRSTTSRGHGSFAPFGLVTIHTFLIVSPTYAGYPSGIVTSSLNLASGLNPTGRTLILTQKDAPNPLLSGVASLNVALCSPDFVGASNEIDTSHVSSGCARTASFPSVTFESAESVDDS
mmetsp:Transcript_16152/g.32724  ORF Transcript_16152/g.32724 Transcript_16152/m.32724 type:complete len:334 (+) Transcript_16152:1508-2509(+)